MKSAEYRVLSAELKDRSKGAGCGVQRGKPSPLLCPQSPVSNPQSPIPSPQSPVPIPHSQKLNTFEIILLIKVIFPKIYQVRA